MRVCFSKGERVRFLSHLDLMKTLVMAMRRAKIPFAFTKGFNPRPKVSMGPPLPVGITSEAEYMDLELEEEISLLFFSKGLTAQLPLDLSLKQVAAIGEGPSLMALLDTACYLIPFPTRMEEKAHFHAFNDSFAQEDLTILRTKKGRTKKVDLKPLIKKYELTLRDSILEVRCFVSIGQQGNVRPEELLEVFPKVSQRLKRPSLTEVTRIGLFYEKEGSFLPPF